MTKIVRDEAAKALFVLGKKAGLSSVNRIIEIIKENPTIESMRVTKELCYLELFTVDMAIHMSNIDQDSKQNVRTAYADFWATETSRVIDYDEDELSEHLMEYTNAVKEGYAGMKRGDSSPGGPWTGVGFVFEKFCGIKNPEIATLAATMYNTITFVCFSTVAGYKIV